MLIHINQQNPEHTDPPHPYYNDPLIREQSDSLLS